MNSDKEILFEYHERYTAARKKTCYLVTALVTGIILVVAISCALGVYFGLFYETDNDTSVTKPTQLKGPSCSDPCM